MPTARNATAKASSPPSHQGACPARQASPRRSYGLLAPFQQRAISTRATTWAAPATSRRVSRSMRRAGVRACCTSCRPPASPGAWRAPGLAAKRKNASSRNNAGPAATAPSARRHAVLHITKYRNTRYWAVWEGHRLLCVTVYKKGARAVIRRITAIPQASVIIHGTSSS